MRGREEATCGLGRCGEGQSWAAAPSWAAQSASRRTRGGRARSDGTEWATEQADGGKEGRRELGHQQAKRGEGWAGSAVGLEREKEVSF